MKVYKDRGISGANEERILAARKGGLSVRTTAAKFHVDTGTLQRLSRPFVEAAAIA